VILTGLGWAEDESRRPRRAVTADHGVIIAGPILTDIRVSNVTPAFGRGTVSSVEAALR
jgi:hypothetical protein